MSTTRRWLRGDRIHPGSVQSFIGAARCLAEIEQKRSDARARCTSVFGQPLAGTPEKNREDWTLRRVMSLVTGHVWSLKTGSGTSLYSIEHHVMVSPVVPNCEFGHYLVHR